MDRTFLSYYDEELSHLRDLATEFSALHPTIARNLQLDTVPCPDPYVERLLEGVAFLAARTRLKVDLESTRYVEALIDALAPDLLALGPAVSTAVLQPGSQVQAMAAGHVVRRGTRLVSAFREELATRAIYTTAQDVALWPIRLDRAEYLPDRGALHAAGLQGNALAAEAGVRLTLAREGPGALSELALDRLDLYLGSGGRGGALFDAIHGQALGARARAAARPGSPGSAGPYRTVAGPALIGVQDREALLPPLRPGFGGYRLLREYFLMPERFHYLRLDDLRPAVRDCGAGPLEVVILLRRPRPEMADLSVRDFRLFATPIVNLFERECDLVELDPRRSSHVVHADRTQPRDFEIYRVLRVEDAEEQGSEAVVVPLHGMTRRAPGGAVYTLERRPRRPSEDEVRRGQMRTTHAGDDLYISIAGDRVPRSLDIRALCTNRDLPILDDTPRLLVESGDPVGQVGLLGAMRRPVPGGHGRPPGRGPGGEIEHDEMAWRLVAQLALNHLSLAEERQGAEPLLGLLGLYADRGDPGLGRHAQAIRRVASRRVVERLDLPGPLCFGHGVEITLELDEAPFAGSSVLLLSALVAQLFARHVGINGFVRTRARLSQRQEEVTWPMTLGARSMI
ncbi:Protein ImpG/VasA [Rubellimicrobium mesophilum DSM 19309]|uniref:Protein ImpG/VasA n=1 Tax=Rubellimicrobium mesophilum DSM 19309 TaxID=442562 RepID=A0A017HQJ2_9RHOB|nr:type VI secretion system baseplate subunit TssF [Rubellimicrobium mesophilum]EYD76443.1 Protein ImpG/VasA [Rubellimicrobium mesophilum DSM 19309]